MARVGSNSYGNTKRDVMRFCREVGVKPSSGNVERMQRELVRSQSDNERVERIAKETGRGGLRDGHGRDVKARVKQQVRRKIESRGRTP